jgi:hypothetical protein
MRAAIVFFTRRAVANFAMAMTDGEKPSPAGGPRRIDNALYA